MLKRDPAIFNDLIPEAIRLFQEDTLALLPPAVQDRAVADAEVFEPTSAITRTNGFASIEITVYKTGDSNTVEAFHIVDEKLRAINEANENIDIAVGFEQSSFIEESISGVAREGGLGDDIDQILAVGIAPEWMSEKALAIGTYCVASGAYVMFGGASPVSGMPDKVSDSVAVSNYISKGWEELYGGKLEFIGDPDEMVRRTLDHIEKKRKALGLRDYDPDNFGASGDTRILELEELPIAEQRAALYGVAAD
jgi:hypothetical protein